jgi:formylglycine-generating enzyme required for sulfatase activity
MRWTQAVAVAAGLAAFAGALALREPQGLGQCSKNCPPEKRDARGCCPAPPPGKLPAVPAPQPKPAPAPQPKPAPIACTAGEHESAGHCCRLGEEWVPAKGQCVCVDSATCGTPASNTIQLCPDGMVHISAGKFIMGSPDGTGEDNERPPHQVQLKEFCLDRTEVTVVAYARCVAAGTCVATHLQDPYAECNDIKHQPDHPVNCVDWSEARAFCAWTGGRLPSEEEWEYAARGPTGRTFPWGEAPPSSQLCWDGDGNDLGPHKRQGTCRVGTYPTGMSSLGVLDMVGNVWEWTADVYCGYDGPPTCTAQHVLRGGSWASFAASEVRTALRRPVVPASNAIGFRCARTIQVARNRIFGAEQ